MLGPQFSQLSSGPSMEAASYKPWADRIREYRLLMGWRCQRQLAEAINAVNKTALCDGNTVSRWERGEQIPSEFYIGLLCMVFEPLLVDSMPDAMKRREFIRESLGFGTLSLSGSLVGLPWEQIEHALNARARLDQSAVDCLDQVIVALEKLEMQVSPLQLIGPTLGHLSAIKALLGRSLSPSLRSQLASVGAETAGLLAITKAQAGDARGAAAFLNTSLGLAAEASDRTLGAWIMGRYTAAQPAYRNNPRLRLGHFTEGAWGFSVAEASPRAQIWFAAKAADVHASLGREEECLRALDQADSACHLAQTQVGRPERPLYVPSEFNEAWLLAERGVSLSRLGRSEEARRVLDEVLVRYGESYGRGCLWLSLAKARTYVCQDEPEPACRQASEVAIMARNLNYEIVLGEVRSMHTNELITRWPNHTEVRELNELVSWPHA